MNGRRTIQGLVIGAVLSLSAMATAQTCDDFDGCTVNDMCTAGECAGTPQAGGDCDDFDDCTVNDRCTNDPFRPCAGDPAPVGATCSGGCGECQEIGPGVLTCGAAGSTGGEPCDPGLSPCLEGVCQVFQGGLIVACIPSVKECPDTDGNPCTDACNGETGECQVNAPKCVPQCESCNPSTGACEPTNEGIACDDFNPCSPDSRCEATDIGGSFRGFCLAGESTPGSATPTPTIGVGPTATEPSGPTPTVAPTACVGDCDDNGVVAINELIIGVNIALGSANISTCESFDTNSNGMVDINELIGGVNAVIGGCV